MINRKITFGSLYFTFLLLILSDANSQIQGEIPWPTLMDSPWPMVKHDPQGTGRSPYIGPKTPNVVWTMDMEYGILSGPIIGPDMNLYFGTNTSLIFNDTSNYFYSADHDGKLLWEFLTFEPYPNLSGYLISSDSIIYFNSIRYYLYALDLIGQIKWSYQSNSHIHQPLMNIDLDGNVYFVTIDGYLNSINNEGEIEWRESYETGFWNAAPVLSNDGLTIYIAGEDSSLYALNLDGSLKWKISSGPASIIPLVDNNGNIYTIAKIDSVGLHSIYPNGSLRWSYNFANWNAIGPLMLSATMDRNGNIYFHAPSHSNNPARIISLDYFGNFRWEYVFEEPDEWIVQPLICDADGTVYCGSTWGYYYYAISSEGELLWKLPLNGYQVDNSGAIGSDGTLYIGTHLGSLVTGQEKTLIAIRDTVTSVEVSNNELLNFKLDQNYPNPFNSTTHIRYSIPQEERVVLKVYDILGKEVATLLDRYQDRGEYDLIFQANDLPSGIYFYTLKSGNFVDTKKLILLK